MTRLTLVTCALFLFLIASCGDVPASGEAVVVETQQAAVTGPMILSSYPYTVVPVELRNVATGKCMQVVPSPGDTQNAQNDVAVVQQPCANSVTQEWYLVYAGNGDYQISAGYVGKLLTVAGDSEQDHAPLTIWGIAGQQVYQNQLWQFWKDTDGTYQIRATFSGKCVDLPNIANGTPVEQLFCSNALARKWTLTPRGRPNYLGPVMSLMPKHATGKCLDIAGGSMADGAAAQQFDCVSWANNERYYAEPSGPGSSRYFLRANHSNKCLRPVGASTASGVAIEQSSCAFTNDRLWTILDSSDGAFKFVNFNSSKCLQVRGGSSANGAVVEQSTCSNVDHQDWRWVRYTERHLLTIEAWNAAGNEGGTLANNTVSEIVQVANGVYNKWGLKLIFDPATDKQRQYNDYLSQLDTYTPTTEVCHDGFSDTPDRCAMKYAQYVGRQWSNSVVVIVPPAETGTGWSSGELSFLKMPQDVSFDQDGGFACGGPLRNRSMLAHELGHYVGLSHTHPDPSVSLPDGDLLMDTWPNPGCDPCLAPTEASANCGSQQVQTNNIMSYYYNFTPVITPMQGNLVRATASVRGRLREPTSIGVYRQGEWYLDRNGSGQWEFNSRDLKVLSPAFGQPNDSPLAMKTNATRPYSGHSRLTVYNSSNWWIDHTDGGEPDYQWGSGDRSYSGFGQAGDIPIAGMWSHYGSIACLTNDCIGVFKNGEWWLDLYSDGTFQTGDYHTFFGQTGDKPFAGTLTGAQYSVIGVYRSGEWFIDSNNNGVYDPGVDMHIAPNTFGQPSDTPVIGNWSGRDDGKECIGVFNAGNWWLDYNCNYIWDSGDVSYSFGQAGDKPVVGNWH